MVCYDSNRHQKSMEGILEVVSGGQCPLGGRPTIRQPGFTLPRQQWSLLNRFRTVQGHCGAGACRKTWCLTDTDLCSCSETKMMSHSHIVESCPLTKLNGGLCPSFTLLMTLLLPGWPTMGLNRIRKKKIKKEIDNERGESPITSNWKPNNCCAAIK